MSALADFYFLVAMPSRWPTVVRRLFVVTLPLSGPLLLLWWLALPVGGAAALACWMVFLAACWIIYPVAVVIQGLCDLWKGRPPYFWGGLV